MIENVYIAILFATIATYICRASGVIFSNRLSVKSELFELIRCISIGIIVSVIFNIIFYPKGILVNTSLYSRSSAVLVCISCFFLFKKNILLCTIMSTLTFFFLNYLNY